MSTVTRQIEISNTDDVIDVRDITERVEQLEDMAHEVDATTADFDEDEQEQQCEELAQLNALLGDLRGNGGDHDWRGDWYPLTLIRESHFEDYAQEFADDIGAVNTEAGWPNNHIDWRAAANELLIDYSSVEFDGVTYYYR